MNHSIRGAARAVLHAWPLSRFRSFEERLGVIAFALMLIFVLCQPLPAQEIAAGEGAGPASEHDRQSLPGHVRT